MLEHWKNAKFLEVSGYSVVRCATCVESFLVSAEYSIPFYLAIIYLYFEPQVQRFINVNSEFWISDNILAKREIFNIT